MNTRTRLFRIAACLATVAGLASAMTACGDDDGTSLPSDNKVLGALLSVDDLGFLPDEWEFEENMRTMVDSPVAPWENTLDPYLCAEADVPAALTRKQAQLELTGASVMEIIIPARDANDLYDDFTTAYAQCGATSSLPYVSLAGVPAVGDESMSYQSSLGVVTIARFDTQLMVLKWWVGDYWSQVSQYYPQLITAAADKLEDL